MYADCFNSQNPEPESHNESAGSDSNSSQFAMEDLTDLTSKNGNDLVRPCDVKGVMHCHSRYCDGAHPLISMVETAHQIGLEYLGISDHFKTDAHEDGMDLAAAKVQRHEVELLREKYPNFDIFQGVELDANPDGSLPVDDATLMLFDYVIVSFPKNDGFDSEAFTQQVVKVAAHPLVTILGRPVGDLILNKNGGSLDMRRVLEAAAEGQTAVEVNANPDTESLQWEFCQMAQELGVYISISPNAHRAARLVDFRHGTEQAYEAGLRCSSILNTLPAKELKVYLGRNTGL